LTHHAIHNHGTLPAVPGVYELREELLERAVERHIRVVAVSGEVDMAAAPAFQAALLETLSTDEPAILDLSNVSYMDSSAIAAMLAVRRQAELDPGRFAIVCEPDGEIARTLGDIGLDTGFSIVGSRAHAAADLTGA
jgi:anti-sigma B factor antagonist